MAASNISQQPRLSFPVPAELRESIYSYLVAIKHDCLDDDWDGPPSRQLHTQLFEINKTICEEALGHLYRTHRFVRFHYSLPDFREFIVVCNVPFVTTPVPSSIFSNNILTIEAHVVETDQSRIAPDSNEELERGTAFLQVQDLPALCDMLRMVAIKANARHVLIDAPRSTKVEPAYQPAGAFLLKLDIDVRETVNGTFGVHEEKLLRHLRALKGAVVATFRGFRGSALLTTESVAHDMCPALIWRRAHAWNLLDAIMRWKRRADLMITAAGPTRRENLPFASQAMARMVKTVEQARPVQDNVTFDDPAVARACYLLDVLPVDIKLSVTQALMFLGQMESAAKELKSSMTLGYAYGRVTCLQLGRLSFCATIHRFISCNESPAWLSSMLSHKDNVHMAREGTLVSNDFTVAVQALEMFQTHGQDAPWVSSARSRTVCPISILIRVAGLA